MENSGNKQTLRLWLRWLNCTTRIENEIRRRLREQFQVTLPQFDLLSALERTDEPMTMSELSQYLLVSNGNVCLLYTSPSPRDVEESRMPSSA